MIEITVEKWQLQYAKHVMEAYKRDLRMLENRRKCSKRYDRRKKKCNRLMEFKHQNYVFYKYGGD